jgi:hypothetical protein
MQLVVYAMASIPVDSTDAAMLLMLSMITTTTARRRAALPLPFFFAAATSAAFAPSPATMSSFLSNESFSYCRDRLQELTA